MKKGFTLLELLVTLAIISVLTLIAFPLMTGYVKTSKQESAIANAAAIYTIADNYLYDDILLNHRNIYDCANGCVIESNTIKPEHRQLVDLINEELPEQDGTYTITVQPGGNLHVEYRFPDNTKGKYPDSSAAYTSASTTRKPTRLAKTGTYPSISTLTTAISSSSTSRNPGTSSSGTSDCNDYIYNTSVRVNSTWPVVEKKWPTRTKGDTFKVDCSYWIATAKNVTINESHDKPYKHPQVIEINNVIVSKTSTGQFKGQDGNIVTSFNIGDIYYTNGSYYVCISKPGKIDHLDNDSKWVLLR